MRSFSDSYREAGVNIEAGYEGVKRMRRHVERTLIPGVISDIGGFGGLFAPDLSGMAEPVLVSGTDGVGTKIRIAQLLDKHDTVGIDCVAMCVNDIICCGAKPLFFLDYIAIGKNDPEKVATLVAGVAEGCVQAGCALIGGETAEHPGVMAPEDYDLAGFSVGVVDRPKVVDHRKMRPGDVILALPSSGVHSNGFSLVRKVFDVEHADLNAYSAGHGRGRRPGRQPHHRRRLLREYPPLPAGGADGQDRPGLPANSAHLLFDPAGGEHSGARHVQYL